MSIFFLLHAIKLRRNYRVANRENFKRLPHENEPATIWKIRQHFFRGGETMERAHPFRRYDGATY